MISNNKFYKNKKIIKYFEGLKNQKGLSVFAEELFNKMQKNGLNINFYDLRKIKNKKDVENLNFIISKDVSIDLINYWLNNSKNKNIDSNYTKIATKTAKTLITPKEIHNIMTNINDSNMIMGKFFDVMAQLEDFMGYLNNRSKKTKEITLIIFEFIAGKKKYHILVPLCEELINLIMPLVEQAQGKIMPMMMGGNSIMINGNASMVDKPTKSEKKNNLKSLNTTSKKKKSNLFGK